MKSIGITGGLACGKSQTTDYLQSLGWVVIDADLIVRDLLEKTEIQDHIRTKLGTSDKNTLRQQIFSSAEKRKILESILHPRVIQRIQELVYEHKKKGLAWVFVSIPLLFEKKLETMFDSVLVVSCNPKNQLQRMRTRQGMTEDLIQAMIQAQMPLDQKILKAGFTIQNDGSIEDLHRKIDQWLVTVQKDPN